MNAAPNRLNAKRIATLVRYLMDVPSTALELVEVGGLGIKATRRLLVEMEAAGCIHVLDWEQDRLGRYATKVYGFGAVKSKPRPRPNPRTYEYRKGRAAQIAFQNALAGV